MGDGTGIEWTDASWNPIVGCTILSPGCKNCYAMKMAARIEKMNPASHYAGTTKPSKAGAVWTGKLAIAPESVLFQPLRWKRPRLIFVNSMGDLFHEDISDADRDLVFAVIVLAKAIGRQHTFQILTKRAAVMRAYFEAGPDALADRWGDAAVHHGFCLGDGEDPEAAPCAIANSVACMLGEGRNIGWPLANVWLGVSAEDQARADERIPDLLKAPAAVHFVSAEPLLGPLDLRVYMPNRLWNNIPSWKQTELDWIIVGGESGPGAREMRDEWADGIFDHCREAGVAFFMKQMGGKVKSAMLAIPPRLAIREMPKKYMHG